MTSTLRNALLAAAIIAVPLTGFAQSSNPAGNLGSNNSTTASPSTANAPSSTLHSGDAKSTPPMPSAAAQNPHVPGATGKTVVPGTTSTIAGDRGSTANAKTGTAATSDGNGK